MISPSDDKPVRIGVVWASGAWKVVAGRRRPAEQPEGCYSLFKVIGEKLPKDSLPAVAANMQLRKLHRHGVYIVHDSMGYARYIGRGFIFGRLRKHFLKHPLELVYYSFFVVKQKKHEGEIETLLIRAAGPHLHFNTQKKRIDIRAGSVHDFERGTRYYRRVRVTEK